MAQPAYQRQTLNYKRFMPHFAGGYAFVVVKSPAQYELLVGDAPRSRPRKSSPANNPKR